MPLALQRAMSDDVFGEKIATERQVGEVGYFLFFLFFLF